MKAWVLDRIGDGVDQLQLRDVPDPQPEEGEVVLEVRYAAEPGRPLSGRRAISCQAHASPYSWPRRVWHGGLAGPGRHRPAIGRRACRLARENWRQSTGDVCPAVAVAAQELVEAPESWSETEAASATLVYLTALQALNQWGDLPPSVVLITGALGGVGVAATQLGSAQAILSLACARQCRQSGSIARAWSSSGFRPAKTPTGDRR